MAFAESRIRRETIAAEDVLHDLGAISVIGSDSQGMGRIGETIARTWQLAAHMKAERGSLPEDSGRGHDNHRIKRYVAKYTINPARIYGIDHEVGSLEPGKLADIVLWEPNFFGIKPELVFKGGFPAWSVMGESNASLMTCEPLHLPAAVGRAGPARHATCLTFMAQAAIDDGVPERIGLRTPAACAARNALADEGRPAPQRRAAVDRGRPGDLPREVGRRALHLRADDRVPLARLYVLK